MPDFLISLIAVVVILGFMILIHEFGHYAVAKLLGVRVEVFSIGFGKRLLGFRKGDTDYRISAPAILRSFSRIRAGIVFSSPSPALP